jgi:hypothetical protein
MNQISMTRVDTLIASCFASTRPWWRAAVSSAAAIANDVDPHYIAQCSAENACTDRRVGRPAARRREANAVFSKFSMRKASLHDQRQARN